MQIGSEEGRWALWSSQSPTEEGAPQGGLLPRAKNFLSSRQNPDCPPLASFWNVAPVKAEFPNLGSSGRFSLPPPPPRFHSTTSPHRVHAHVCTHTRVHTCAQHAHACVRAHSSHTHAQNRLTDTRIRTHTSTQGRSCNLRTHVRTRCSHSPVCTLPW